MTLSAYEVQRLHNIKKNEEKLAKLGLGPDSKKLLPPAKSSAPRKKKPRSSDDDPDYRPEPRRTRARSGGGGSAPTVSDDDDDEDDGGDEDVMPLSKRRREAPKPRAPPPTVIDDDDDDDTEKIVKVEAAKTGRSKCRCCMEPIAEKEMRVGMESWMVGRQVVVWNHPACFLSQVSACEETSGRGKCKQTKQPLATGERTLLLVAHSTTAHVKLEAAGELLAPVLRAAARPCSVDGLRAAAGSGESSFEMLDSAGISALAAGLAKGSTAETVKDSALSVEPTPSQDKAMGTKEEGKLQPEAGSISKAKGKVVWKWAGALCYGKLLPSSETATHCYARTQRGNTKTLTKGGSYWWQLLE